MKAISLWQPWATLVAMRLKQNETRSWSTAYRGWIAIHAAKKKFDRWDYDPNWVSRVIADGVKLSEMPYGAFLCIARLHDCLPAEKVEGGCFGGNEEHYGDYSAGRFAWLLRDTITLPEPIPFSAHQGLFNWPDGDVILENYEERCGIKEFSGNMPREQAEKEAREEIEKRATKTPRKMSSP